MVHILDTYPVKHHTLSYCLAFLALSPGFAFAGLAKEGFLKLGCAGGRRRYRNGQKFLRNMRTSPTKASLCEWGDAAEPVSG